MADYRSPSRYLAGYEVTPNCCHVLYVQGYTKEKTGCQALAMGLTMKTRTYPRPIRKDRHGSASKQRVRYRRGRASSVRQRLPGTDDVWCDAKDRTWSKYPRLFTGRITSQGSDRIRVTRPDP